MPHRNAILAAVSILTLTATPALAQDVQQDSQSEETSRSEQRAKDDNAARGGESSPTERGEIARTGDQEWISLTGKVASVDGDSFTLDYGSSDIIVEMDDYDMYEENFLRPGDEVIVTGEMDKDFHEDRTIEASSVYVDKLNEYFYANAADEEEGYYIYPVAEYATDEEWVGLSGTVVATEGNEMTLDAGLNNISVDLSELDYEPLLDFGDRVTVYGEMDDADLFEEREILASSVVILSRG